MKISRDWLSDFLDWIETDPQVIADRITRGMGEVDDMVEQGAILRDCVVGRILTVAKHPNADKLSVCTVQTDRGVKTVVCGGTNVRIDMLVAFAHVGATVKWHGGETMTLAPVHIRGVESHGMICASEELGLENLFPSELADGNRPIVDLARLKAQSSKLKAGMPLRQALGFTDVLFCIDNHAITNRPDLFSHIGVARELTAMGLATWKKKPKPSTIKSPSKPAPFKVINDAKDLVPYYEACLLSVPAGAVTPDWMQQRLLATGWRSINLIVDVTNYVLMEIGMPLHAFDADDFRGDLHIRTAKKGEKITTLDSLTRELPEGSVIISDNAGIFDLFGVMGGLRTSQKPTTSTILLQAGIIDPVSVRRTVTEMGHRTDAATVYEKGVMPVTAKEGLRRAIALLQELAPGTRVIAKPISWGAERKQASIKTSAKRLVDFIGGTLPAGRSKKILTDLGCTVKVSGDTLTVTPPAWRRDLLHLQDLVEEVARVHGYANIAPAMPEASIAPPARDTRINILRDALKEDRFTELLHLAFTSPSALKKAGMDSGGGIRIENPIGEEASLLRPSLLPAMLETVARETPKSSGLLKVYEYGRIFAHKKESMSLAVVVAAKGKTTLRDDPVLTAKTDLTNALRVVGYEILFTQTAEKLPALAHAGRSATILCKGKSVGLLTEIHPTVAQAFDLPGRTAAAVIDLDVLLTIDPTVVIAQSLPAFPSITLDETIPLLVASSHASLLERVRKADPLLTSVETVDLYDGDGSRTVTLRFTYRAADRTLTQEEVEKVHAHVVTGLRKI